jgi:type VI secretion system protein ImpC
MTVAVSSERIDREIARLDAQIASLVDAVLHDEKFQALEAAWRGLAFVVDRIEFQENIEVAVWSYSKEELAEDCADHADITHTRLFRTVYAAEYGVHGGRPYGAILANWSASAAPPEIDLLRRVASVAAMAHAPVLLAASPELLGVHAFSELQAVTHPQAAFELPGGTGWATFRGIEDSRYVGVLFPRMLLRLPYREASQGSHGSDRFVYDERIGGPGDYLWGSPIFAFAVRLADSFARYRSYTGVVGTFDDRPAVLDSHPALGFGHPKPPVEVVLSRRLEQSFSELGFIPLTWDPIGATLRFTTANSVQAPRSYGSTDGGASATLSHLLGTRLPYLLLASRFAHYLKVLERERIGAHRESTDIERELNEWLSEYVVVMDSPSPATRLKYPLRNARVKVTDVEGAAGIHRMEVILQPHLRYMRQAFTLSVSGRLEAR